jgi:hypothetical protein
MRATKRPQVEMLTIPFAYLRTICKYRTSCDDCKHPMGHPKESCGCAEADTCPIWAKRPTPWIKGTKQARKSFKSSQSDGVPW